VRGLACRVCRYAFEVPEAAINALGHPVEQPVLSTKDFVVHAQHSGRRLDDLALVGDNNILVVVMGFVNPTLPLFNPCGVSCVQVRLTDILR
jgi:hypothetical protein